MDSTGVVQPSNSGWQEIDPRDDTDLLSTVHESEAGKTEKMIEDVLLDHLELAIIESEKRMNGPLALKEYYTVYLIETKVTNKNWKDALAATASVWRRYSDFEVLRHQLEEAHPNTVVPPLPEKKASFVRQTQSTDNLDPLFVDRRRVGLESFLLRVCRHPVLCRDRALIEFLQQDRERLQPELSPTEGSSIYVHRAETKIKSMNAALRLKKTDETVELHRQYGSELETGLGNLLRVRVRLADRIFAIHKLHGNYGRVFSEWSALEKTMGDGLQRAGHYMDCYSSSIDSILEEEDLVVDQLKEYYYFGAAVGDLCNRHQMAQFGLERAESHLTLQRFAKERHDGNDPNVLTKLWGKWSSAGETLEERQAKARALDQNIDEAQRQIQRARAGVDEFAGRAQLEMKRFHAQKDRDLKESLANYVMLQLKLLKTGLQTWKHIKEALQ